MKPWDRSRRQLDERNEAIVARVLAGVKYEAIASEFEITHQRVCQIWQSHKGRQAAAIAAHKASLAA